MRLAALLLCVVVLAVSVAAQDYFYGADPAPSMYAQQAGQSVAVPAPPSYDAIMSGLPPAGYAPQPALVEQQQTPAVMPGAPFYSTQEAVPQAMETDEEESEDETEEGDQFDAEAEAEGESEAEMEESADMRFQSAEGAHGKKAKVRMVSRKGKHSKGKRSKGKGSKKHSKKHSKGQKSGKKSLFTPQMGAPKHGQRKPTAKTPHSAGGKPMPPMPAPLPDKWKPNCKRNPAHCIDAETPAAGEKPGDHSPKAVFKKKMEIIKKSLMVNNRNIAQELKWIDQVEKIMKQYNIKVKKVREHITDERKAIKELLRQRRIVLNEKKQKELELKLKVATTELTSLTDALQQVQKKEKELGKGKGTLKQKIGLLANDLKKLKTDKDLDEKSALSKRD